MDWMTRDGRDANEAVMNLEADAVSAFLALARSTSTAHAMRIAAAVGAAAKLREIERDCDHCDDEETP